MNSTAPSFASPPPLLPSTAVESARLTYLRAVGVLFPGIALLNFSRLFLVPKLNRIWEKAQPEIGPAQWLHDAAVWLPNHSWLGTLLLVSLFVIAEFLLPGFAKRRSTITTVLVIVLNLVIVSTLAAIPVAGFLAAPLMAKHARESVTPPKK